MLAGAVVLALLCGVLGWMLLNVLRRMTLKSLPLRLAVSRLLRQPWSTLSQLSAFSLSFMLLAGWMLLNVLRRMTLKSLPLRLAVSRLLRQPWSTLSQLSAFSLSFMLLALLLVLRGDLLDRWQQQLPPESPNYFLINIATEQVTPLKAFLAEHQIVPESFYPVVRARLTAINDKPTEGNGDEALNRELNLTWQNTRPDHNPIVAGNWPPKVRARLTAINDKPTEGNGDEALNRELNLTWQNTRPDHNPIVAGNWPPKAGEVSMEEGLAKRLNVALGDTVTFMGDTQEFRAKVTSLRKVDWESLRPNFYFIFPEGALDGQPQSWLTSFRWENGNGMLTQLNRQFPTISLLDIGAILKQVGQVLEQVSRALEVMVVLVTACGMLLLLAQVQVGMRQRHQELVVWRTLGAGKKLLRTLTSFRWENGNGMLTQLNRQFPTISLLDIGAILKQVGQVLEQVSRALEVMVVLVTACGMLLLLAQVQVGMRQRHQELVVWRTLGAGKKLLRTTLWCEFAMLGFVSGLVAAIGAETALAVLQSKVFDFPWEPDWRLWIVGDCGLFCRAEVRYCCRFAAAGWVRDCLRVRRCSGSLRGDDRC